MVTRCLAELTLEPPGKATNCRLGLVKECASTTFCNMCKFVATSSMSSSMAWKTGIVRNDTVLLQRRHTQIEDVSDSADVLHRLGQ
jgi:hypothetical protein